MIEVNSAESRVTAEPGGSLCISLDFELMWGVRDKRTTDQYGANITGGRDAVRQMLDMFHRNDIRATWATVGLLFCETKEEMLASLPEQQPTYTDQMLSNYTYLDEVGENEAKDPYHFAPSLVAQIKACPGQEVATHTFSHYYCLEPGQTRAQFAADLDAAIKVAAKHQITFKSIVFPRNQYDESSIAECTRRGISIYRGNETSWMYRPGARADQTLARRAIRLTDSYVNLSGTNTSSVNTNMAVANVRSSRFLRPYSRRFRNLEPLRLSRITAAMTAAARHGETFHIWWHPHNMGANQSENLDTLRRIIDHFITLRCEHGMCSLAMEDFAPRSG
ncbi:MAG: polysaccharide deacetylase family protein [Anderseniella sp.]|nr:polysaccharide deacetylase family protein [Anderseniella sp.]